MPAPRCLLPSGVAGRTRPGRGAGRTLAGGRERQAARDAGDGFVARRLRGLALSPLCPSEKPDVAKGKDWLPSY